MNLFKKKSDSSASGKVRFNDLIKGDRPVLVDFYADWCGPCRMMPPILKELKRSLGDGVEVIKIDVDKNQQLATTLRIQSIPTLVLYKKGKIVWRQAGVPSAAALIEKVRPFV
jgi:thioredoxin 1